MTRIRVYRTIPLALVAAAGLLTAALAQKRTPAK